MHDSPLKFIGQLGGLYSAVDDKFLRSTEILFRAAALETNRQFESIGVAELQARSAAKCRKEKPVVLPLDGLFPHLHARRRQTNKTPYLHARNYRQRPNGPALRVHLSLFGDTEGSSRSVIPWLASQIVDGILAMAASCLLASLSTLTRRFRVAGPIYVKLRLPG